MVRNDIYSSFAQVQKKLMLPSTKLQILNCIKNHPTKGESNSRQEIYQEIYGEISTNNIFPFEFME